MRSREEILSDLTFKKQFQGSLADKVIIELLLDIRDQNTLRYFDSNGKKSAIVSGFEKTT